MAMLVVGHASRVLWQCFNLKVTEGDSDISKFIWLSLPFGILTCLMPIGFTFFAFKYYEVTSLTLMLIRNVTPIEIQRKIKCIHTFKWTLAAIFICCYTIFLTLIASARQIDVNNDCTTRNCRTIVAWSIIPNFLD